MKIKVFVYSSSGVTSISEVEESVNDFIQDKDVVDIKVSSVSKSVSVTGQYFNKCEGPINVIFTVMYNESEDKLNSL